MADDGLAQSDTIWPMPKFHFEVKWDGSAGVGMVSAFQEVSGLDLDAHPIAYRAGNSPVFSIIKMPGLIKSGNVTLKKGVFKGDNKFYEWYSKIKMNTIARTAVTINLLDEKGTTRKSWTASHAYPVKLKMAPFNSIQNGIAIEEIEICLHHLKRNL